MGREPRFLEKLGPEVAKMLAPYVACVRDWPESVGCCRADVQLIQEIPGFASGNFPSPKKLVFTCKKEKPPRIGLFRKLAVD